MSLQLTPARGWKLSVSVFIVATIALQLTPARGWKHENITVSIQINNYNSHPQGDGNMSALPKMRAFSITTHTRKGMETLSNGSS